MSILTANRSAVKRVFAERYMLLMLVSFALSVTLTRFYLELAGYPKIGNSELHIAHVLWGGLLLFIGALFPLTLANRWAYSISAILTGVGIGLFIDEVGKFITESNDYFYPIAAPIIYTLFLLSVWVYLRLRQMRQQDSRTTLYRALDDMKEVLDHDLDEIEHDRLLRALNRIAADKSDPNLARLSVALQSYIQAEDLRVLPVRHGQLYRWYSQGREFLAQRTTQRRLKALLLIGFTVSGLQAILELLALVNLAVNGFADYQYVIHSGTTQYISTSPIWITVYAAFSVFVGCLFMAGIGAFMTGREVHGLAMGVLALTVSLTILDLISFYFNQFYTVTDALAQFSLLSATIIYRRRYVQSRQ